MCAGIMKGSLRINESVCTNSLRWETANLSNSYSPPGITSAFSYAADLSSDIIKHTVLELPNYYFRKYYKAGDWSGTFSVFTSGALVRSRPDCD